MKKPNLNFSSLESEAAINFTQQLPVFKNVSVRKCRTTELLFDAAFKLQGFFNPFIQ